jgi:hypothetical protein
VGNGAEEVVRKALARYFAADEEGAWELFDDALKLSWGIVFGDDWASKMSLRDLIPVDDRRVLALTDFDPSGVRSGVPIEGSLGAIYEVADGRIVATRMFTSGAEARRAAGIE